MPNTPSTITMTEDKPDPNPLTNQAPGSKIVWYNGMTVSATVNYPTCVSPGGSAIIASGQSGATQTVNANSRGSYAYSYSYASGATSDGTIDVS